MLILLTPVPERYRRLRKEVRQLDEIIDEFKKEKESLEKELMREAEQHQERQAKLAKLEETLEPAKEEEGFGCAEDIQSAIDEISEQESQYPLMVAKMKGLICDIMIKISSREKVLAEKCKQLNFLRGTLEFSLSAFNEDVSKELSHKGKEEEDDEEVVPTNSSDEEGPLLRSVNRV